MPDTPITLHAMAFVDGQNLYQHAKAAFGYHHPNFDPVKLHAAVCLQHGWKPNLVRFYTGIPSRVESEMWAGYWSNRVLSLKRSGVDVVTRPLRYRKTDVSQPDGSIKQITTPQEKGIDVRMSLDILINALKRSYDVAVIFSQDQDLAEIVHDLKEIARQQDRFIRIVSAFPDSPTATAKRGIDKTDWFRMNRIFYDSCLDHYDYRPRNLR